MIKSTIILVITIFIGGVLGGLIGYYIKTNVKPISEQINLKSGQTNIEWIIKTKNYCEGTCKNYSSSNSSWGFSSWGGGGGGGK